MLTNYRGPRVFSVFRLRATLVSLGVPVATSLPGLRTLFSSSAGLFLLLFTCSLYSPGGLRGQASTSSQVAPPNLDCPTNLAWICRRGTHSIQTSIVAHRSSIFRWSHAAHMATRTSQVVGPWNVSALTSASSDSEPTLVINFGTAKYIFNASEGMGRSWLQSHHTFRKTKAMFLTAAGTHRCGGVAGMSLFPSLRACRCKRLCTFPQTLYLLAKWPCTINAWLMHYSDRIFDAVCRCCNTCTRDRRPIWFDALPRYYARIHL